MHSIDQLSLTIQNAHSELQVSAANAVNKALTIRNWLIGYYIVEYEQNGLDRAEYGDKLISNLALRLKEIKGLDERGLRNIRLFYNSYTYLENTIRRTVSPELDDTTKFLNLGTLPQDLKEQE